MSEKGQKSDLHSGHRERLREKFLAGGNFMPHELLELLLTYSIPRVNTNETAHRLINYFGSIDGVLSAGSSELQEVPGVGEKSAVLIRLVAEICDRVGGEEKPRLVLDSVGKLGRYGVTLFRGSKKEAVYAVLLDSELRLNDSVCIAGGGMSWVKVDMQKIVNMNAVRKSAAVVLLHNHPDGFTKPSEEDMEFAARATEMFNLMGIEVIEHIIVAGEEYRAIMGNRSLGGMS